MSLELTHYPEVSSPILDRYHLFVDVLRQCANQLASCRASCVFRLLTRMTGIFVLSLDFQLPLLRGGQFVRQLLRGK